ncbi:MAG: lytic transglycosylase domain-containing protein [Bryobacteraceae bacterium]
MPRLFAIAAAFAAIGAASAAERAVLVTGGAIHADRHEVSGEVVRLYTGGGEIELPMAAVALFEQIEPPQAAAAPVPAISVSATPPAPVNRPDHPNPATAPDPKLLLNHAAERYGLPPELVHSVARVESAYRVDAVSPKGAIGVMQLMPQTAAELGANPNDVEQNVDAGVRHLRDLLVQNDGSAHRALAAYNAGQGAVDRHKGIPPYRETTLYVEKVLRNYYKKTAASSSAAGK